MFDLMLVLCSHRFVSSEWYLPNLTVFVQWENTSKYDMGYYILEVFAVLQSFVYRALKKYNVQEKVLFLILLYFSVPAT